ncbi:hypothetical protein [Allorhizobium taibaishanense]|uniref:Uncharacterized protein n=1 Tax=Allorhizobium taibaishanense TaxID=887144 RepID=A0A7W6HSD0_9HYPH|nr:hypothetical protein [Allorhizobium taibaishanense]MBB4009957.1 hypothetical protein [Allorhizobium taibaishanense]
MKHHAQKPKRRMQIFVGALFIIACLIGAFYVVGYHPGATQPENPLAADDKTHS